MVAEAAQPRSKQHATRAAKARREEMIREQLEREKADGAATVHVTTMPAAALAPAASQ